MFEVDHIFVRANEAQRERTQFVTLKQDGFRLGLRTQYIKHGDYWALWVLTLEGEQVFGPLALVRGVSLLAPHSYSEHVPKGQLWVSGQSMTLATADITALLLYRSKA